MNSQFKLERESFKEVPFLENLDIRTYFSRDSNFEVGQPLKETDCVPSFFISYKNDLTCWLPGLAS